MTKLTPMHERPEVEEAMILIIEECSEVTKGITKIFRGGFEYPTEDGNNKVELETEMIDLQVTMDIYYKLVGIDKNSQEYQEAYNRKINKLKEWSNLGDIIEPKNLKIK